MTQSMSAKPPIPPPPRISTRNANWLQQTVIEPPVRSRPYRSFRGTRHIPTRKSSRRIFVDNDHLHYPSQQNAESAIYGSAPVQAVHAASAIDLAAVISKVFPNKTGRKMIERLSVVVQLPEDSSGSSVPRFVAVFRFGPVCFFNMSPRESSEILAKIKQHATNPVLKGHEQEEKFCVHIQPKLFRKDEQEPNDEYYNPDDPTMANQYEEKVVTGDYCIVQELNLKSVDVISNVMAQSVALDSYNEIVDELLAKFSKINNGVTTTGDLTNFQRKGLFQTVAQNNRIAIDMVSKVGIKDRSDTAWNLSQYEDIYYGMREEFEIDTRFEHIEFKLDLIQQNAKFFLEVLDNQKSNSLEWIIIVLISFECALMCAEMSGAGEAFFTSLKELLLRSGGS